MQLWHLNNRGIIGRGVVTVVSLFSLSVLPLTGVQAQTGKIHNHRGNIFQRHPTATGVVTGMAVHHHLKHSAMRARRSGKHLSFAQRHPTLAGAAAGLGTHHILKHSHHTP